MPKETNKKQGKEKKHFMKDFKAELKKVSWPTPKQLVNNTISVITVVLITAAIVFALDFIFESANTYGIDKIKEIVESSQTNETANSETSNTVENNETSNSVDTNEVANESVNQTVNEVAEENNSEE